ncbi:MAG: HRDC domain-containing protein [Spirochaetia bacterium]|nr:HRDC domain-containing protein [Spirochaetia bacterium]
MEPYVYITRQHQLDLAVSGLKKSSRIAVDTESSGFYTYFSELCLIQLSSEGRHYIIDVLGGLNLSPIAELFSNHQITKIFHAAQSDLQEMKREFNWNFINIFDTYLSCRMLDKKGCSLAHLVKDYMNIDLEKKEQKSNWKKRPLTRSQLEYAYLDTAYLELLMDRMSEELKAKGLYEEILEEFDFLTKTDYDDSGVKVINPDSWMKIPGACTLSSEKRGILKSLVNYREQNARKLNKAPFRLVTNALLFKIAKAAPQDKQSLIKSCNSSSEFIASHAERILQLVKEAEPLADCEIRRTGNFQPEIEEQFKKLKKWRQKIAEKRKLESSVVLSNRVLKKIAEQKPKDIDQLRELNLMTEWKINHYGNNLLEIISGVDAEKIELHRSF